MDSNKAGAKYLREILKQKGVKHLVISPGSRNAPLIISLTADPYFTIYSIVDERSASFFALGICQSIRDTVAVICTSGSALLNIGPAVAEAYYQRLPLLVISADRPSEWVGQGESQTIDQAGIFRNFIRHSYDLVQEPADEDALWYQNRQISEAINRTRFPYYNAVHINMRFREALYGRSEDEKVNVKLIGQAMARPQLARSEMEEYQKRWLKYSRIMIICGLHLPDDELRTVLKKLASKNVVILTETTSNLNDTDFFPCIDRIITPMGEKQRDELCPELLISIGGPLVTRRVKTYLRNSALSEHWRVDVLEPYQDAFKKQSEAIQMQAVDFLAYFTELPPASDEFIKIWKEEDMRIELAHDNYLKNAAFSDLKVFEFLQKRIPDQSHVQVANSSAIRYMQLFRQNVKTSHYSNRGTSGIEGSLSTATGFASQVDGLTLAITGDLSMMYDSNALWNKHLSANLKIVVINNGGGGIFRIIPGPKEVEGFETYIEARHELSFEKLAELHGLNYHRSNDMDDLEKSWEDFMRISNRASMLEIDTSGEENDIVLMNYFKSLEKQEK